MKAWERELLDSIGRRAMRRGDSGLMVKRWQARLRGKGFVITVDGDFGAKTEHATKVAQTWAGLKPTGAVGPPTWRKVGAKRRTPHPISAARALLGRPKIIDARHSRNGFPAHPWKRWGSRSDVDIVCGHYTGGPASFLADARFHVQSDYLAEGGAPALAYTLGVDKDGTLYVFNEWQAVTWHCDGGKNTATLGLVFRGGSEGPTRAQQKTLKWVLAQLEAGTFQPVVSEPRWPQILFTTTHRHIRATSCPGELGERFYRQHPAGRFATSV